MTALQDIAGCLPRPHRPWDAMDIREAVARSDLRGGICGRVLGYWIGEDEHGPLGTAWMCNMANAERFDVTFPVTLTLRWDTLGMVSGLDVDERFEGSQGLTCSRRFIERHARKSLIGHPLRVREPVVAEPLSFGCRHVFELVYGLAAFKQFVDERGEKSGDYGEATINFRAESGLQIRHRTECLGEAVSLALDADLDPAQVEFDQHGVLQKSGDVAVRIAEIMHNNEKIDPGVLPAVISGTTNATVTAMMVRGFTPIWRRVSALYGQPRGLLCSTLWPPSMYSVLVQGLSQILFHDNFTYFQYCVAGLQRASGQPKCVGVIRSLDEAAPIFPELTPDDII